MAIDTNVSCQLCDGSIGADPRLECAGCGAHYHRACRLEAGRCVTVGCRRATGLAPRSAAQNDSVLSADVGPYVWGALWAVPLAAGLTATFFGLARGPAVDVALKVQCATALWVLLAFLLGAARARVA